jgi:hypothetical protein
LQVIDRGAMKIALVSIPMAGSPDFTDGDIRRGFLSGLTLDDPIESITTGILSRQVLPTHVKRSLR